MSRRAVAITLLLGPAYLAACVHARAQVDPATLAAHDAHQGLLVAVDPYTSASRAKAKFGKHAPNDSGILAVDVYFRNDNDSPIRIDLNSIRLRIGGPGESKQRLPAISSEDVADRTLLKTPRQPTVSRFPGPLPGELPKGNRSKDWQEFDAVLRSLAMASEVLPPHATVHGFFYFDIDHHYDWLSNASLDVPNLEFMTDKKALFFFDVDLSTATP